MNKSPEPPKKIEQPQKAGADNGTMTFTEALSGVLVGKKITKLEWGDEKYYGFLQDERLRLHKPDGKSYDWIISEGDLRGDDYTIV